MKRVVFTTAAFVVCCNLLAMEASVSGPEEAKAAVEDLNELRMGMLKECVDAIGCFHDAETALDELLCTEYEVLIREALHKMCKCPSNFSEKMKAQRAVDTVSKRLAEIAASKNNKSLSNGIKNTLSLGACEPQTFVGSAEGDAEGFCMFTAANVRGKMFMHLMADGRAKGKMDLSALKTLALDICGTKDHPLPTQNSEGTSPEITKKNMGGEPANIDSAITGELGEQDRSESSSSDSQHSLRVCENQPPDGR